MDFVRKRDASDKLSVIVVMALQFLQIMTWRMKFPLEVVLISFYETSLFAALCGILFVLVLTYGLDQNRLSRMQL